MAQSALMMGGRSSEVDISFRDLINRLSSAMMQTVIFGVKSGLGPGLSTSISLGLMETAIDVPFVKIRAGEWMETHFFWELMWTSLCSCKPAFERAVELGSIFLDSLDPNSSGALSPEVFRALCSEMTVRTLELAGGRTTGLGERLAEGLLSVTSSRVRLIVGRIAEELEMPAAAAEELKGRVENLLASNVTSVMEFSLDKEMSKALSDKLTKSEGITVGPGSLCQGIEVPGPSLTLANLGVARSVGILSNFLFSCFRSDTARLADTVLARAAGLAFDSIGATIDEFFRNMALSANALPLPLVVIRSEALAPAGRLVPIFKVDLIGVPDVGEDSGVGDEE